MSLRDWRSNAPVPVVPCAHKRTGFCLECLRTMAEEAGVSEPSDADLQRVLHDLLLDAQHKLELAQALNEGLAKELAAARVVSNEPGLREAMVIIERKKAWFESLTGLVRAKPGMIEILQEMLVHIEAAITPTSGDVLMKIDET